MWFLYQRKVADVHDNLEQGGFRTSEGYVNSSINIISYLLYTHRSTTAYNAAIKRKIINEIRSTPNCSYIQKKK